MWNTNQNDQHKLCSKQTKGGDACLISKFIKHNEYVYREKGKVWKMDNRTSFTIRHPIINLITTVSSDSRNSLNVLSICEITR